MQFLHFCQGVVDEQMKNRYNIDKIILQRQTDFPVIALKKHRYRATAVIGQQGRLKRAAVQRKTRVADGVPAQGAVSNVKICGDSNREIIVSCVYYLI